MSYEYGLSFLTTPELDPVSAIHIAAECGYQHVGLRLVPATSVEPDYEILNSTRVIKEVKNALTETGVSVLDVELIRVDQDFDLQSKLKFMETAFLIGAKHINIACTDHEYSRLIDNYSKLCEAASSFNLTCDIEFLPWTTLKNLNETTKFIEIVKQPNAAVMVDILHVARSATTLQDIRDTPAGLINYVQICDALKSYDSSHEGLLYTARYDRLLPNEGELELQGFMQAIPANKPICIEVPNLKLAEQYSAKQRAELAIKAAKKLTQELSFAE